VRAWMKGEHAPAAAILVRLLVGGVVLSEGIQKFLYPPCRVRRSKAASSARRMASRTNSARRRSLAGATRSRSRALRSSISMSIRSI
jgi:hypothetical protein